MRIKLSVTELVVKPMIAGPVVDRSLIGAYVIDNKYPN
jgi:hypothetical protein